MPHTAVWYTEMKYFFSLLSLSQAPKLTMYYLNWGCKSGGARRVFNRPTPPRFRICVYRLDPLSELVGVSQKLNGSAGTRPTLPHAAEKKSVDKGKCYVIINKDYKN